ncbi:MFS transporter [Chloroflexota bacterium]
MQHRPQSNSALMVAVLSSGIFCITTGVVLTAALLVDLSREFNTTVTAVGQLITLTAISWGLLAPIIGPLSDRFGHKRTALWGLTIYGIAMLGYSISRDFSVLAGFSILAGLGGAATGPNIIAIVGDYFPPNNISRRMAMVIAGIPLASLAGVPLGALIAGSLGWRWSFLTLGLFMIAIALTGIFALPPSHRQHEDKGITYLSSFSKAFRHRPLLPLLAANTLLQAAYWTVATYLVAFLIQSYSLSTGQVAPLLLLMGIGQLVGTLAGGSLADNFSKSKICLLTQVFSGLISLVFMLFTKNIWLSVFLGALFMGLYGSTRTPVVVLMVSVSGSDIRGTIMGMLAATNQWGRGLGALAGGLMLALLGYNYLGVLCLVLSLLAATIFFYVSFFLQEPG